MTTEILTIEKEKAQIKINDGEYTIPKNVNPDTLGFLLSNTDALASEEQKKSSIQTEIDALSNPEDITEKTLVSALIGAQNRSNQLYAAGINASSLYFKEVYLKYATKYENIVVQLAGAIAKLKKKDSLADGSAHEPIRFIF